MSVIIIVALNTSSYLSSRIDATGRDLQNYRTDDKITSTAERLEFLLENHLALLLLGPDRLWNGSIKAAIHPIRDRQVWRVCCNHSQPAQSGLGSRHPTRGHRRRVAVRHVDCACADVSRSRNGGLVRSFCVTQTSWDRFLIRTCLILPKAGFMFAAWACWVALAFEISIYFLPKIDRA